MHQCIPVFWNAVPILIMMLLQTCQCQPKKANDEIIVMSVAMFNNTHWTLHNSDTVILVHDILRVTITLWQHKNALPWKWDQLIDVGMFIAVPYLTIQTLN